MSVLIVTEQFPSGEMRSRVLRRRPVAKSVPRSVASMSYKRMMERAAEKVRVASTNFWGAHV